MKKNFFLILLIFFLLLSKEVLSDEDVIIKKIAEGLDLPAHLSKNEFISKNSIFVLEHKLGQIIEIQNYNKDPKINQKPILNIKSLISESDSLEQGLPDLHFRQILKKINIFLFHMLTKKIKQSCLDLNTMIKLNKLNYPLRLSF